MKATRLVQHGRYVFRFQSSAHITRRHIACFDRGNSRASIYGYRVIGTLAKKFGAIKFK